LPGVFVVANVPRTWHALLGAATAWAGSGSAVSHRAAAALWDLDGFAPGIIEITTTRDVRGRAGVLVHLVPELPPCFVVRHQGLAVTTIHKTLVDLGCVAAPDLVEQALECALRRRITTELRLRRLLADLGTRGRRGVPVLSSLLDLQSAALPPTESALEAKTIQMLRAHGFPAPVRQLVVKDDNGFVARVDLAYPEAKLIIEVDSRSHHLRRKEWEKDLARRNELTSRGCLVLHATEEKLKRGRKAFLACVSRTLTPGFGNE
jgi:very-short-patch-repair endonuclease